MAYIIDDDETRFQGVLSTLALLEIQTFATAVVGRNNINNKTGAQGTAGVGLNAFPSWPPIRNFGTIGSITLDILLDRVDGHVALIEEANGDIDFAFSNPPPTGKSMSFILDVTVDAVGGYTFNFLNTIIPAGVVIDNTALARTVIRFTTTDNGVTYYAENLTTGGGGSTTLPVIDTTAIVKGSVDATKLMRFEVDTLVPTTTTIVLTVPAADGTIFVTPAVQLLDMNLQSIISAAQISFLSASQFITADTAGLEYNVPTADTHEFFINNISQLEIDSTLIDVKLNSIINAAQISFISTSHFITADTAGMEYNVPINDTHEFFVNNVSELSIENTAIDVKLNSVINAAQISFISTSHFITADTAGMEYNVPINDTHEFFVNNVSELSIENTAIDVKLNSVINAAQISFLAASQFITADTAGMEYNVPAADTHEFFINNISELEINSTLIDVKLNSIINAAQISFLSLSQFITADTAGIEYNVPAADTHEFFVSGTPIVQILSGSLAMQGINFITTPQIGFSILGNIIQDDVNGMIFSTPVGDDFTWDDGTTTFATLDIASLNLNDLYILVQDIPAPTVPTQIFQGQIFFNDGSNRLNYQRRDDDDTRWEIKNLENDGIQDATLWTAASPHSLYANYVTNSKTMATTTSVALTNSTLIYVPIYLGDRCRISEIAFEVKTVSVIAAQITYALFDNYPGENYPRTRLDTHSVVQATNVAAGVFDSGVGIVQDLEPGLYWLGLITDVDIPGIAAHTGGDATSVSAERNTISDDFINVLGYTAAGSSFPVTAASNMLSLNGVVVQGVFAFAEFNPN